MLSRVADSLYWMSRNIERAENNARVLKVQLIHMLEASSKEALDREWEEILEVSASTADYYSFYERMDRETIIQYLTISPLNVNSLMNTMNYARENARATRDILPEELWEVLNQFHLDQKEWQELPNTRDHTQQYLNRVIQTSMTSQGVIESSMSRGTPYSFIKIGKWLERAEKTARILNVTCEKNRKETGGGTHHYYHWMTALHFLNGYDAYIKEYPPTMEPKNVLSFLIKERNFPRSIQYCMDHVLEAVTNLEGGKVSHYSENLFHMLEVIQNEIEESSIEEMGMEELMHFLDHFQDRCQTLSRMFSETYYLIEPVRVK
ncbi:alpha-E domain-containing protein [Halobacillus litoralis]|uniref:Alpha-E domain-containing protein n=1 Tax=Halobacillus litoralis TaxID=45668 RepID=A0A845E223_9BACI|nr:MULTISPECIES: alpha-E domain-containing protein [Halobacillus]MYL20337.1 alpha-E domain-containing protein [Halobacillus litoralis]MYL29432.1 alpha-E domain-containing protein [Halobacillus halophilus]MYL36649.1 alpha-E domain-containing protein [Halobacillus litoralis]